MAGTTHARRTRRVAYGLGLDSGRQACLHRASEMTYVLDCGAAGSDVKDARSWRYFGD